MARPFKSGLDYFPLDTDFYEDPKIEDLIIKEGALGVAVYLVLLALVYKNGYYLETTNNELAKIIFRKLRSKNLSRVERVEEVIYEIAEVGLIDKQLWTKGIITSCSIQKQWLLCTKRRQAKDNLKFWLLEESEEKEKSRDFQEESEIVENCRISKENYINVYNNPVNVNNNSVFDNINTQNKINNKYINYNKLFIKQNSQEIELCYYTQLLLDLNYLTNDDKDILQYDEFLKSLADKHSYLVLIKVIKYVTNAMIAKKIKNLSYFRKSVVRGIQQVTKKETPLDEVFSKINE